VRTIGGQPIGKEFKKLRAPEARKALRSQQLRDASAVRGDAVLELMLRTSAALDAAIADAGTPSARQAFSEAYDRFRSAEDAVRHALGIGYDERIA
jgi:hypothetical protein